MPQDDQAAGGTEGHATNGRTTKRRSTTSRITTIGLTLGATLLAAVAGAALYIWSGLYDISANVQHTQLVYSVLEKTMHRSVRLRADSIAVPPLDSPALLARGAQCYRDKCLQCHGGPGVAQGEIGRSMQPVPGPLVDAHLRWQPQELYWITRNGIKMSGMPAWQHRMPDADLWAVVAYMQVLPQWTAPQFQQLVADGAVTGPQCTAPTDAGEPGVLGLNSSVARGRQAMTQYACSACHNVPGVTSSNVHVGPPLAGFASRQLIAGAVPNNHDNLVRWIRNPRSIDPLTTMPDMQVTPADARDMAAYLATLK